MFLFILFLFIPWICFANDFHSDSFVAAVNKIMPSVVKISSSSIIELNPGLYLNPNEFISPDQRKQKTISFASGIVIDSKGLVITNSHVLTQDQDIKILFTDSQDEKPIDGIVVARDVELDIALIQLKITSKTIPAIFGDSDQVKVGESVIAIGNPFAQGHSVSHGIISAKERFFAMGPKLGFLQTDTPINPGNSGGPLLNLKGEVIGITTAIQSFAQGMSYSIPINIIKSVLSDLKQHGKVNRGYLGLFVEPLSIEVAQLLDITTDKPHPVITEVEESSPADLAGLKNYDVILEVNGRQIIHPNDLLREMTFLKSGDMMKMKLLRKEKELRVTVKILPKSEIKDQMKDKQEQSNVVMNQKTGLRVEILPMEEGGLITGVVPGGIAHRAGLMSGDLILEIDQKKIKSPDQFKKDMMIEKKHLFRTFRIRGEREYFSLIPLDLN